ncbi:2-polyprenyl-6-methoxyphenol hydroxylase-like FAD-dependent oxidoreductase [Luteimonas sp. J16]|jgi:2-polyprenyl-6-methoxyphenol hydroxylase-like FAD-dependent oxidoreductase|uniref:FAD-dependent oxidoreductase n=1 Tax=unclassified Luteimonas TaxID=2629088 RepID=UPI00047D2A2D|nr:MULTISPECIES: NAD(P)/FAD-dependent oxidoreductase [unclassified Luteimonas]TWG94557.1 2-polyprenyl-6-methoxyphenol hydroxylase-like FAD-dependent oxidoreductase [Luteimonas sp. J16]
MKRRIAIIGYGSAGQCAAVLLERDGHHVEVFERVPAPGPVGAGFLLQPSGLQVLWRMGLLEAVLAHGAPVERLYGETAAGRAVMDMRYAGLDPRLVGVGLQRGALFSILAGAFAGHGQVRGGTAIAALEDEGRVLVDGAGRRHGPYDLVVVADGADSLLRGQVGRVRRDRPYPWGALWCLLPAAGWPHLRELRQRYAAARRMVGLLPVGTRPGEEVARLGFFWSLPIAQFDRWHADGVDAWKSSVLDLWPEVEPLLSGLCEPAQLARAGYRDSVLARWHRGRAVLVGDAAHAMSPQLGQGVNMALLDAMALADALRTRGDVHDALAAFERGRRRHVAIYQLWSRWLTPMFQSELDMVARLRDLGLGPVGRLPLARMHMLRVLGGTQQGLFGRLALDEAFVEALARGTARQVQGGQ